MLSQRRIKLLTIGVLVFIIITLYYSGDARRVQNQKFYQSTVTAIEAHRDTKNFGTTAEGSSRKEPPNLRPADGTPMRPITDEMKPAIPKDSDEETEEIPIAGRTKMTVAKNRQRRPSAADAQWEPDWKNIASEWATSLSLGTGITDSRASNSRLLMQLVPTEMTLDPTLPSVAEALAVMAGSTLIMSSTSAPFEPGWNSSEASLATPVPQSFSANVRSIGYASGSSQRWQGVFYVILIFAFITSAICLAFMLFEVRGRQVTDFTDPQNLFTLAMNSPATPRLQGACGAGPQGPQLKERWVVAMEEDHEHYYLRTPGEDPLGPPKRSATAISMASMEVEDPKAISPAMNEYRQLSTQRSFLSRFY